MDALKICLLPVALIAAGVILFGLLGLSGCYVGW